MSKLKKLAGETVLYGVGSILPRTLNFFLVFLHTSNMFTTEQYGVLTKILAWVAFINVVYMFGMETAFFRFTTKDGNDAKRIFNLAQTCVLAVSVPTSLLFILFAVPISNLVEVGGHAEFIVWVTLIMLMDAAVAIPFAKLRLEKKAGKFASAKITNVLILIGLNIYFLKFAYNPSVNVGYVLLANLLANAFFVFFFWKTLINWRPSYDKKISPQMLSYAYPVMLTGVAGTINEMFSRQMLEEWLPANFYGVVSNKAAMGIFGACYKFAVLMNLGIQAFRYAAEPFFFSNAADKNSPTLFAKVNHYFVITCCVVLLGISINLDILQFLIGTDFRSGISIVPILLLAYLFLGVYYNFSVWFKLTDKTYFGTLITVAGTLITVAGNYFLIPLLGYMGSAWAALMCYALMAMACYFFGQKYFPVPYKIWNSLAYIFCTMILIYLIKFINITNQWICYGVHAIVIVAFITVIYFIERKGLKQAL
jgi:O-antigen/teichoic acid export membrane protein